MENEELRGFFFTNMYLSSIQKGIQSAHAVHDLFIKYRDQDPAGPTTRDEDIAAEHYLWVWAKKHKTMIVLDAGYDAELVDLWHFFRDESNPFPFEKWCESKEALNGACTCVAIVLPSTIFKTAEKVRKGKYKPDKSIEDDTAAKRLEREFGTWQGLLIQRLNQYRLAN